MVLLEDAEPCRMKESYHAGELSGGPTSKLTDNRYPHKAKDCDREEHQPRDENSSDTNQAHCKGVHRVFLSPHPLAYRYLDASSTPIRHRVAGRGPGNPA